jgi:poly(A) polymerase
VRLAAELDFKISAETESLIRRFHRLIVSVAGERVREELLHVLATPKAGHHIRYLDDLRLLTAMVPELEPARGVEQPKEHHWDVLNHSLETVKAVEFLLRQNQWEYTSPDILEAIPWSEKLSQHFASEVGSGSSHASLLKLAALLHDIAKPETKIIAAERVRFFGHTDQGAEVAGSILGRLRFSNKEIKMVELMVRSHLRPTQMSHEGAPTKRAVYRYFRDTGAASIDILFLSLADHLGARGPDLDAAQWRGQAQLANSLLNDCFRREIEIAPSKLIDGHDLIKLFGMKPGPQIREILEAVKESQAAGELTTRDEALSYIKNRLLYREQNLA